MIRLPDFVTKADFDWAVTEATRKKKTDFSKVEFFHYEEGRCVQCMHVGSYDLEPITIGKMKVFAAQQGQSIAIDDIGGITRFTSLTREKRLQTNLKQ